MDRAAAHIRNCESVVGSCHRRNHGGGSGDNHGHGYCEAIRYIQLGHPENILIDDGSIRAQFVPEHLQAQWNAFYNKGCLAEPGPQADG